MSRANPGSVLRGRSIISSPCTFTSIGCICEIFSSNGCDKILLKPISLFFIGKVGKFLFNYFPALSQNFSDSITFMRFYTFHCFFNMLTYPIAFPFPDIKNASIRISQDVNIPDIDLSRYRKVPARLPILEWNRFNLKNYFFNGLLIESIEIKDMLGCMVWYTCLHDKNLPFLSSALGCYTYRWSQHRYSICRAKPYSNVTHPFYHNPALQATSWYFSLSFFDAALYALNAWRSCVFSASFKDSARRGGEGR